jgi:hypothetical protein
VYHIRVARMRSLFPLISLVILLCGCGTSYRQPKPVAVKTPAEIGPCDYSHAIKVEPTDTCYVRIDLFNVQETQSLRL